MENISISQIKTLLTVIEEKNISNAATKLNLTQPAISRMIMSLEKFYSVSFFDRSKNPWKLTPAGVVFIEGITNILREHENILEKIDDIVANRKGFFSFGTMLYEEKYILTTSFIEFYEKFADFKLNIFLDSSKNMEQLLLDRKIDFATIILPVKNNEIKDIPLKEYEIFICIPNKFLIEKKIEIPKKNTITEIDLSLFKESPFILHKEQYGFRSWQNHILQELNIILEKNNIIEVPQHTTAVDLSTRDIGICFLLDDLLNHIEYPKNATVFKIKHIRPKQILALAHLRCRNLSNIEKTFIKIIQKNILR